MIVVFGLGNPGPEYEHTRHNVGFDAVSKTAAFFQVELRKRCFRLYEQAQVPEILLVRPLTYMNRSGNIVRYFRKYLDDTTKLVVVQDNMDLACGGLRVRCGGGSSGQKGMRSIAEALQSENFVRIYIGTGRPQEGVSVNDHVLSKEERPLYRQALEEAVELASKAIIKYSEGASIQEIQGEFNRKGIL